ncbi:helix-turn-helix domain-containing protein [Butyrivibrio proteoclasticus]|uniref:helix-turn-helix domain-containing protein n=1 Tax=Butyrivibrio proteoclasticus TaxID=43305 RepID=UPI0002D9041D|nr:helix-turn-helix domain-containing protein [Butyrivibrio proteoclasticus]
MDKIVVFQDVLSIKDISNILGIGINQARALVNRSDFPSIQIGKKKRIVPKEAFMQWLNHGALGKRYVV